MRIDWRRPTSIDSNPQSQVPAERRFLAEGDSWFSLGAVPLPLPNRMRPNLLSALAFENDVMIVNLAKPGAHVSNMAERRSEDPHFPVLIGHGSRSRYWTAVLLSGGGNDLIGALKVSPDEPDPRKRILRSAAEVDPSQGAAGYVSEPGWREFELFLHRSYRHLAGLRDAGQSWMRPILAHTYATPTARLAGSRPGHPGWLYHRLVSYGVPADQRQPLTRLLFERMRQRLLSFDEDHARTTDAHWVIPRVHVFDSAAIAEIRPAAVGSTGDSNDWINEIHLNSTGYKKLGDRMGPWIEVMLRRNG